LKPDMQVAQDALAKLQGGQVAVTPPPAAGAPLASQAPVPPGPAVQPTPGFPATPPATYPTYPQTARAPGMETSSTVPPRYLPVVPVATRPAEPGAVVR
jgi:hypothetical protein